MLYIHFLLYFCVWYGNNIKHATHYNNIVISSVPKYSKPYRVITLKEQYVSSTQCNWTWKTAIFRKI